MKKKKTKKIKTRPTIRISSLISVIESRKTLLYRELIRLKKTEAEYFSKYKSKIQSIDESPANYFKRMEIKIQKNIIDDKINILDNLKLFLNQYTYNFEDAGENLGNDFTRGYIGKVVRFKVLGGKRVCKGEKKLYNDLFKPARKRTRKKKSK